MPRFRLKLAHRKQACSACRKPGHNIRRHRHPAPLQTWFEFA